MQPIHRPQTRLSSGGFGPLRRPTQGSQRSQELSDLLIKLARLDIQCVLCFSLTGTNGNGNIAVKALEAKGCVAFGCNLHRSGDSTKMLRRPLDYLRRGKLCLRRVACHSTASASFYASGAEIYTDVSGGYREKIFVGCYYVLLLRMRVQSRLLQFDLGE